MRSNYLIHFGNKNSGRYPRGSGDRPHQHDGFLAKRSAKKEAKINKKTSDYINIAKNKDSKGEGRGQKFLYNQISTGIRNKPGFKVSGTKATAAVNASNTLYGKNITNEMVKKAKKKNIGLLVGTTVVPIGMSIILMKHPEILNKPVSILMKSKYGI